MLSSHFIGSSPSATMCVLCDYNAGETLRTFCRCSMASMILPTTESASSTLSTTPNTFLTSALASTVSLTVLRTTFSKMATAVPVTSALPLPTTRIVPHPLVCLLLPLEAALPPRLPIISPTKAMAEILLALPFLPRRIPRHRGGFSYRLC